MGWEPFKNERERQHFQEAMVKSTFGDSTDVNDGFDYDLVNRTVERIVELFSPQKIIIFGSVARREAKAGSDIDILVVMGDDGDKILPSIRIRASLYDIHVDKDIIVVTPAEFEDEKDDEYSFINEIVNTGYVAYEV